MRKPNVKKALLEFVDFYSLCLERNKKWTIGTTLFILMAVSDEISAFTRGHGTLARIFKWILENKDIFNLSF